MKKHFIFIALAVVAVLGIGFFLAAHENSSVAGSVADQKVLQGTEPHVLGAATAKVQIVEFGDYQCPACAAVYPVLKQVSEKYKDDPNFKFVFRHFPLPQHQNAIPAAMAAEAAGLQGKFWEMHDLLYSHQNDWAELPNASALFMSYAQQLGLDQNKFSQDLKNQKLVEKINADQSDGLSLGINATPTIYVNGKKLNALPTFNELDQQITDLLKQN